MTVATSALVPPMSSVIALGASQSRATYAPPITPAAVPDSTICTQSVLPRSARIIPPFDLVTNGSAGTPISLSADCNDVR